MLRGLGCTVTIMNHEMETQTINGFIEFEGC